MRNAIFDISVLWFTELLLRQSYGAAVWAENLPEVWVPWAHWVNAPPPSILPWAPSPCLTIGWLPSSPVSVRLSWPLVNFFSFIRISWIWLWLTPHPTLICLGRGIAPRIHKPLQCDKMTIHVGGYLSHICEIPVTTVKILLYDHSTKIYVWTYPISSLMGEPVWPKLWRFTFLYYTYILWMQCCGLLLGFEKGHRPGKIAHWSNKGACLCKIHCIIWLLLLLLLLLSHHSLRFVFWSVIFSITPSGWSGWVLVWYLLSLIWQTDRKPINHCIHD